MLRASLLALGLAVASATNPTYTVAAAATGDALVSTGLASAIVPSVPTSPAAFTGLTMFTDYLGIHCWEQSGVLCQLVHRDESDVLTFSHGTSTPVTPATIISTTSEKPVVQAFNENHGVVCYMVMSVGIACHSLRIDSHGHPSSPATFSATIAVGPAVNTNLNIGFVDFINLKTFDARGAPAHQEGLRGGTWPTPWQGKRALLCYMANQLVGKPSHCHVISIDWPNANGNVPGVLTVGLPTVVVAPGDSNSIPTSAFNNYPGARFHDGKSLTTFDYFNAAICYTMPVVFEDPQGCFANYVYTYWYHGTGECVHLSLDVATGSVLTVGTPVPLRADAARVTDISVEAFKPKSGDPTRALVCYITVNDYGPYRRTYFTQTVPTFLACQSNQIPNEDMYATGFNGDLVCTVMQRTGSTITFSNREKGATGLVDAKGTGADTTGVLVVGPTTANYNGLSMPGIAVCNNCCFQEPCMWNSNAIKATTITAMDEYNAMVCYTVGDNPRQCSWPDFGAAPDNGARVCGLRPASGNGNLDGGDGFRLLPSQGGVYCKHVWITGYGNSAYAGPGSVPTSFTRDSDGKAGSGQGFHASNDAMAAQPYDVGTVTGLYHGPQQLVLGSSGGARAHYPIASSFAPGSAAVCFVGPAGPECKTATITPKENVWDFNAPVDCMHNFNCPTATVVCPTTAPYKCEDGVTCVAAAASCPSVATAPYIHNLFPPGRRLETAVALEAATVEETKN